MARSCLVLCLFFVASGAASADTIVPAPGESGHDAALLAKAETWVRLQAAVLSVPVGFGLEAFVSRPEARAAIESFIASGAREFDPGVHPYALVDSYNESGDLGMFGGVQAAGDAFRYVVLRDSGAPPEDVDAARAALLRTIDGLHWQTQITGESGIVARGIMRITSEEGEPPVPGPVPELVPLFDASGNPIPEDKTPTWRADNSGELPFLIWIDDCSKDQLDGYVLALGAVYDAIADDPTIDRALLARLIVDARAIGERLMQTVEVNDDQFAELVIQDADGRPTTFHDLSAEEIAPGQVLARPINGFNAIMGLGILRTLYHITGDDSIGRFYYEELIGARDYLRAVESSLRLMYIGTMTNYSNVNMAFVALWGVLRYETDPTIRAALVRILENEAYAPGVDREARGLGLPFFDFIYAGFRGALDANGRTAIEEGMTTLRDYAAAPVWNPEIVNCDSAELESRTCVGADGTPLTIAETLARGDYPVAIDPVPIPIRPPSNFEHRSDPHRVNGGGGDRLNPAGDVHAAYWMGRLLEASADLDANVSPRARDPLPWTPAGDRDAGVAPELDAGMSADGGDETESGGCGCRAMPVNSPSPWWLCLLALLFTRRERA